MSNLHNLLFGIYPYIALSIFFLGSLIRFDREQYTWKSDSSQLLRLKQLRLGSNLFHIGILFLFFGHAAGLLTPHWVYESLGLSTPNKQMLAIISGGRFKSRRSSATSICAGVISPPLTILAVPPWLAAAVVQARPSEQVNRPRSEL